jgi:hypothetical protein
MRRPRLIEIEFAVLIFVIGAGFILPVFEWLWPLR